MLRSKYNLTRKRNMAGIIFGIVCMVMGVYFFFRDNSYYMLLLSFVLIMFNLIEFFRNESEYKKEESKEVILSFISAIFMMLFGVFSEYKIVIFLGMSLIVLEIIKLFRKKRKRLKKKERLKSNSNNIIYKNTNNIPSDFDRLDIKEYPQLFTRIYQNLQDGFENASYGKKLLRLYNKWSDMEVEDKNFIYASIIVYAESFDMEVLEDMLNRAESLDVIDEKSVEWFRNEALSCIEDKKNQSSFIVRYFDLD